MSQHTFIVNGMELNADVKKEMGVIEVTNVYGITMAVAETFEDTDEGSYTLFDENGDTDESDLPNEFYRDIEDGDGLKAAEWLCSEAVSATSVA